jgi:hypothetical protein
MGSYTSLLLHCRGMIPGSRWTGATSQKAEGSISGKVIGFFSWPTPSSRTMALGSTQPLTEMSARNLPGGKSRLARKVGNLTAVCGLIV